jgi:hypothetical protein
MTTTNDQWIRKIELFIESGPDQELLDLSEMHIKFTIQNANVESPNTAVIRVYNLSKATVAQLRSGEFSKVTLNAGYQNGNFGAIFKGTTKQIRIGRENSTDTYLDILASDGDLFYNQCIVNMSTEKGQTQAQELAKMAKDTDSKVDTSALLVDKQHVPNIRGSVRFGMARAMVRNIASTLDASWSLQNGIVMLMDKKGYLPGETVEINIGTGLIGMPEQTDEGIKLNCLLNSRIRIGGLVKLNNDEIIQLMQADPNAVYQQPYSSWAGVQPLAPLNLVDGVYEAFVVEHEGDTRGHAWYSRITCLAMAPSTSPVTVKAKQ